MNRLRSFILFSVLSVLLMSIYTHFNNTESYLNYMSHSQIQHDFDRDGDSENTQNHTHEMLKIPQLNILPTVAYMIPASLVIESKHVIPIDPHRDVPSAYILSIFRPPICG